MQPVAIFPIPISDVLGTTQHRQVNVFEAGLMERRFQRGFENPACGKAAFREHRRRFQCRGAKAGHEPGEVDAFIADGEDHDDVARFECYEFSRFARLVTKVRGTPQSESRQFSELCISAQRRNPTQDTTYAETGRPRGQFLRAMQTSPRPRLQQRHIRRNSQPLGRGGAAASNLDAPEGIRRQPPQAATRMTKGGPPREVRSEGSAIVARAARRPARGAHEATATKLPTKHNTQFNGSEHTQCPPRKTYFTATCPAAPPGTGFPIPAQRSNQAHGRPSLLPAQLHRHPLLQQHAAIRFDHIQIVDRPSRYCVCDSFAARAADATAASCARVWSARIRRFARLSSTSRNAFSTVCRYSATSSS